MSVPRRLTLPLLLALAVIGLGMVASACGSGESHQVAEGEVLKLGELKYTVTFSRYLNIHDSEDVAYLAGKQEPPKETAYFGVWFEVQNETEKAQTLPTGMTITDANDNNEYKALESESIFAFPFGGEVEPEEQIPALDSPAQQGPIQGSIVIFELNSEASENRPLTLHLENSEGEKGEVELDL